MTQSEAAYNIQVITSTFRKIVLAVVLLLSTFNSISISKADTPTISISNITTDKSSVNAGDQLTVSFRMSSTNLSVDKARAIVDIYKNDLGDCDDFCPSASANLVGGDLSNGTWQASISVPSNTISGNYTPAVIFAVLKGTPGNIGIGSSTIFINLGVSSPNSISPTPKIPSKLPTPMKNIKNPVPILRMPQNLGSGIAINVKGSNIQDVKITPSTNPDIAPKIFANSGNSILAILNSLPPSTAVKASITISGKSTSLGDIQVDSNGVAKLPTIRGSKPGTYLIKVSDHSGKSYSLKLVVSSKANGVKGK